ncbi:MAG: hypothetical protein A4S16_01635 [Proteobacteria bacterium SG_bin6]|nr:MAG: hypothetical protein A4S16_01635 [Proteobacteria bacterium SG_bin6]
MIDRLPPAIQGQYIVRDEELRGFFVVVGAKRKTCTVQGECRKNGRRHHRKVAIGLAGEIATREARVQAKAMLAKIASGELVQDAPKPPPASDVTLRQAWDRYRVANMERKERSPATIRNYTDHVERVLADWHDVPPKVLGDNPRMVAERHHQITVASGPCAANGAMRTLRAICGWRADCRRKTRRAASTGTPCAVATPRWSSRTCRAGSARRATSDTRSGASSIFSHSSPAPGRAR